MEFITGDGDQINILLEGIPSVFDFFEPEENTVGEEKLDLDAEIKSHDFVEQLETQHENNHAQALVMPPKIRSMSRNGSEEYSRIRRRVRGLLNRLGESNVERIIEEMSSIYTQVSFLISYILFGFTLFWCTSIYTNKNLKLKDEIDRIIQFEKD
ncbi:putative MIF4G-like domain superfamily protein [Helianthus debilis subsp. tardiflorus]